MWKHPLTWVGLALLIAVVAVWDYSPEDLLKAPDTPKRRFPQAYMIDSETRRYDASGALEYRLQSERADHYQIDPNRASDSDYSLIQSPDIVVYRDDGSPWQLTARLGRTDATGEPIRFTGDVRAWREESGNLTEITTPELLVFPDRQYAETDKAVNMRSPQGEHTAIGLEAELNNDHIELLSEVRGTYEPL